MLGRTSRRQFDQLPARVGPCRGPTTIAAALAVRARAVGDWVYHECERLHLGCAVRPDARSATRPAGSSVYAVRTSCDVAGCIHSSLRSPMAYAARRGHDDFRFLGLSWSRTSEVEWLDRIELRRIRWRRHSALALVDECDSDAAVLGPLTEGEARWMASIIADVFKDALPKEGQTIVRWSVTARAPACGSKLLGDRWLDEPIFS